MQNLHLNGRSLLCFTACCFKYHTLLNSFPQSLHAHCWFFSSCMLTKSTSAGEIPPGGSITTLLWGRGGVGGVRLPRLWPLLTGWIGEQTAAAAELRDGRRVVPSSSLLE